MRLTLARPTRVDLDEAARYLKSGPVAAGLTPDLEEAAAALLAAAHPAAAALRLALTRENGTLRLSRGLTLSGNAIARHLDGCDEALLLGVTLGFDVDRLIAAAGQSSPYRALLLDACATAAIEDVANQAEALLAALPVGAAPRRTWRFSPGYGDLPLATQPALLELLDARRAIGLTVSASLMLSPIKSVTALIGLSQENCAVGPSPARGCAACSMGKTCSYRRPQNYNKT